jgi:hypothetical protein
VRLAELWSVTGFEPGCDTGHGGGCEDSKQRDEECSEAHGNASMMLVLSGRHQDRNGSMARVGSRPGSLRMAEIDKGAPSGEAAALGAFMLLRVL